MKKEKTVQYVEFKMDFSKAEIEALKEYALEHIINDENALCNYAVNKILEQYVDKEVLNRVRQKKEKSNGKSK